MKSRRQLAALCVAALGLTGCENKVEEAVKRDLMDGVSAQFRDVQRCPNETSIYKGEVNAKNRMGAYTGYEPFFYDGVSVTFVGSSDFGKVLKRCYGKFAEGIDDSSGATGANAALGAWTTHETVNPVDDSKTRLASLTASEGTSSTGDPVVLTIRCQSNKTELYVNWNDYLGDDSHDVYAEWKRVTVRVGAAPAATQRWGVSTDSNATFTPGSPVELIKRMAKADRLVLQTTPYNENPVTAVFPLKGIDVAVKSLAEGCGWKL
jgi:hypothetical protein